MEAGQIQPLHIVFRRVKEAGGEEILDVDLFRRDARWVYALRVLGRGGRIRDVLVDASTLAVIEIR